MSLRMFPRRCVANAVKKYFDASTVEIMERTVLEKIKPQRTIRIPVFSFGQLVVHTK